MKNEADLLVNADTADYALVTIASRLCNWYGWNTPQWEANNALYERLYNDWLAQPDRRPSPWARASVASYASLQQVSTDWEV